MLGPLTEEELVRAIAQLQADCYATAVDKGWWDGDVHNIPEKLALIHSEVSEALEDYRKPQKSDAELNELYYVDQRRYVTSEAYPLGIDGNPRFDTPNKPCGFPSELADIVIRVFDLCGYLKIDLAFAVLQKMKYNATRQRRHGGKLC